MSLKIINSQLEVFAMLFNKHLALSRHIAFRLVSLTGDTLLINSAGNSATPDVGTILGSKGIRIGINNTRLLNVKRTTIIRIKVAGSSVANTRGKSSLTDNNVLAETSTAFRATEAVSIVVKAGVVIA